MAYTRVNWQNSPSHATPLSAENLNVMDAAIEELDGAVTDAEGTISTLESTVSDQATTISGLQTTVGEHTADIQNNSDYISDLQTLTSGHTTSIGNLQTAVGTNTEDITDLKEDLSGLENDLEEVTVDGYNLIKTAENGVGAYYASGSTLTFNASYTSYCYAIIPVEKDTRYYVSTSPRWWVLTDDNNVVLASGTYFLPSSKKFIDTGNATKFYFTIPDSTWNAEATYGSQFAVIVSKSDVGSGSLTGKQKLKPIMGLTQRTSENKYAFAIPRVSPRFTVGFNQKWYFKNALSLDSNFCKILAGIYGNPTSDGVEFAITTATNAGSYYCLAYDQNLALVEQQSKIDLIAKADNLSSCSALVIGDSTVAQNKVTETMLNAFTERNKTLTLLGTQGTSPNNHEGRSGWSAKQYCTQSSNNPFYNNGFDFSHYMTNQGYASVDFVVVQLGINDLYNADFEKSDSVISETLGYLCAIIDSILAWNTSQKVIINLPTSVNPNWAGGNMTFIRNVFVRYNAKALIELTKYSSNNVRPSHCHLILDPYNDISDNVHPKSAGYEKMGLEVVSQINCYQNS